MVKHYAETTLQSIAKLPIYVVYAVNLAATLIAHPIDVMRVNVQANVFHFISLRQVMQHMFRQRGLGGFYYGAGGACVRCTVHTFAMYTLYHHLRNSPYLDMLKPYDDFTVVGLSGFGAGFISTPFAKVSVERQADLTRSVYSRRNYRNIYRGLKCMYSKGGLAYLFAGSVLNSFTCGMMALLHLPVINQVQSWVHTLLGESWQTNLTSLMITGTFVSMLLTPVDAIKTIVMVADFDEVRTKKQLCYRIMGTHGIKGFFFGLRPTLVGLFPHALMATVTYHKILQYYNK